MLSDNQINNLCRFGFSLTGYEKSAYTLLLHFLKKSDGLNSPVQDIMLHCYEAIYRQFVDLYQDGKDVLPDTYLEVMSDQLIAISELGSIVIDADAVDIFWQELIACEKCVLMLWSMEGMNEANLHKILGYDYTQLLKILTVVKNQSKYYQKSDKQIPLIQAIDKKLLGVQLEAKKMKRISDLSRDSLQIRGDSGKNNSGESDNTGSLLKRADSLVYGDQTSDDGYLPGDETGVSSGIQPTFQESYAMMSPNNEKPSADNEEPSANNEEPSANNEEPSANNEKPSADDKNPSPGDKALPIGQGSSAGNASVKQTATSRANAKKGSKVYPPLLDSSNKDFSRSISAAILDDEYQRLQALPSSEDVQHKAVDQSRYHTRQMIASVFSSLVIAATIWVHKTGMENVLAHIHLMVNR